MLPLIKTGLYLAKQKMKNEQDWLTQLNGGSKIQQPSNAAYSTLSAVYNGLFGNNA